MNDLMAAVTATVHPLSMLNRIQRRSYSAVASRMDKNLES
jgi:hypothetical protein